jgi:hypothetical protein
MGNSVQKRLASRAAEHLVRGEVLSQISLNSPNLFPVSLFKLPEIIPHAHPYVAYRLESEAFDIVHTLLPARGKQNGLCTRAQSSDIVEMRGYEGIDSKSSSALLLSQ